MCSTVHSNDDDDSEDEKFAKKTVDISVDVNKIKCHRFSVKKIKWIYDPMYFSIISWIKTLWLNSCYQAFTDRPLGMPLFWHQLDYSIIHGSGWSVAGGDKTLQRADKCFIWKLFKCLKFTGEHPVENSNWNESFKLTHCFHVSVVLFLFSYLHYVCGLIIFCHTTLQYFKAKWRHIGSDSISMHSHKFVHKTCVRMFSQTNHDLLKLDYKNIF